MTDELEPSDRRDEVSPFEGLEAPEPVEAAPPTSARVLAFAGIVVGGLLGGMVGYGVGELTGGSSTWAAVGGLVGGVTGAGGVGVLANLTLRAMNEWKAVEHPEADDDEAPSGRAGRRNRRRAGREWSRRELS